MEALMSDLRDPLVDRPPRAAAAPEYDIARVRPAAALPPRNPRSTASIAGHPIHPMLIPFPIAFFVATFLCDIAFWRSGNASWVTASEWLLGAGLVMAALAAVAGLIDVLGESRIRALREVWWHAGGNVLLVLIQAYSCYARYSEGAAAVMPKGLILSVVAICLM